MTNKVRNYILLGIISIVSLTVAGITISNNAKTQAIEEMKKEQEMKELRQKEIEDAKTQAIEETKREQKRKEELQQKIVELTQNIEVCYKHLEKAKSSLNDARSFKVMRSRSVRDSEILAAEKTVKQWEKQIEELEQYMKGINPGWSRN